MAYVKREKIPGMKWCPKCPSYQPHDSFKRNKGRGDRLSGWCKSCYRKHSKRKPKPVPVDPYERMGIDQDLLLENVPTPGLWDEKYAATQHGPVRTVAVSGIQVSS